MATRFYRTDLQAELQIAQRDAEAGASDKVAALAPIILGDAQNAQLPQDIINGPRGLASSLKNGGDSQQLKAAYDLVVADNDAQSLLGPGNPSAPPPQLYNQSNTSGLSQPSPTQPGASPNSSPYGGGPPGGAPPGFSPPGGNQPGGAPPGGNQGF